MTDRPSVIVANTTMMTGGQTSTTEAPVMVAEALEVGQYPIPRVPTRWFSSPDVTTNPVLSFAEEIQDEINSHLNNSMSSATSIGPEAAKAFNVTELEYSMRGALPGSIYTRDPTDAIPSADAHSLTSMLYTQEGAIMVVITMLIGE